MATRSLREQVNAAFVPAPETTEAPLLGAGLGLRRLGLEEVRPRPDQPRRFFDPEALEELTQSIRRHGILQPIRVRPASEGFEIIAGERRWTAAQRAGLREIPALIVASDDDAAFVEALVENIQREDLSLADRANALLRLRTSLGSRSWSEVGQVIGVGRQHVHRLLGVTKLPGLIQDDEHAGGLSEKHTRALLLLRRDESQQLGLWERIKTEEMSGDEALRAADALRRHAVEEQDQLRTAAELVTLAGRLREVLRRAQTADLLAASEALEALRAELEEVGTRGDV